MKRFPSIVVFLSVFFVLFFSVAVLKADPPNPPIIPGQHGSGGNTGAPLDGMLGIFLLVMGCSYGGWMLYEKKKKNTFE